jgi:hypothetical protein
MIMTDVQTTSEKLPEVPGFKVEIEVSAKDIAGLLCSGFEGGVGYWCRIMDYRKPKVVRPVIDGEEVFRHTDYPLLEGGAVICRLYDEPGQTDKKYNPLVLDRAAIQRGLTLMATTRQRHWADFLSCNYDSNTGDVFIQLCLLGDVVYG